MPSRSERHAQTESLNRRVLKNQELYQEIKRYDNYHDIGQIEPLLEKDYDLELARKRRTTRAETRIDMVDADKFPSIIDTDENQERDINKILTEAKKLREHPDELESKRRLKKDEYNITSQVDVQNIEEIRKARNTGVKEEEQGELKELIDTIYSSALKEEIDEKLANDGDDLFSDLMPSREDETLIHDEELSKDVIEEEMKRREEEKKNTTSKVLENSFFTKSMELTTKDMEDDEDELFMDEKKLPVWAILLVIVTILAIVGLVGYFVYKSVL